jgi:hypothetical protein
MLDTPAAIDFGSSRHRPAPIKIGFAPIARVQGAPEKEHNDIHASPGETVKTV